MKIDIIDSSYEDQDCEYRLLSIKDVLAKIFQSIEVFSAGR